MKPYDPTTTEERWQKTWEQNRLFQGTVEKMKTSTKEKEYVLYAFPYPSGSGLHVGHVEPMTALDMLVRFQRMQGKDVFFPMGWDAFGLPAENFAIKTGVPPAKTTKDAIDNFRRQIKRIGISYDWDSELATCHPGYYQWTQWIFIQLFKAGLAYRDKGWVNWCPSCKTVLANEQVVNGECERCGSKVIQKELEQWKFRITAYQDQLLDDLSQVDWPKATKEQQINWIGKSKGLSIDFTLKGMDQKLTVWTKFWETVFGTTFVVIAPEKFKEFALLEQVSKDHRQQVLNYLDSASHKTEEERRIGEKDKTGVDTGLKVINPVNGQEVPLYIADYVLMNVGTGVVMGVPAHDDRDFAFAKKFNLGITVVVDPIIRTDPNFAKIALDVEKMRNEGGHFEVVRRKVMSQEICWDGNGLLINSGEFDGMNAWGEGKQKMAEWMIEKGVAKWQTTYKLRDWLISRQRYWGAPIPMVYCAECAKNEEGEQVKNIVTGEEYLVKGWYSVPETELPVILPEVPDFMPTDDGKSPIEKASEDWKYTTCPGCGGKAKREVDTMDTFVDSSWYYLRYPSRNNEKEVFDKQLINTVLPVDMYLIGPEHIVLHLLYSRFFTKFLRDAGYLSFDEPFMKMRHQGMILGPDGKKMSKSKGNVINPDDVIEKFGTDTLRVYEMFMGPLEGDKAWDMGSVAGVYRFLTRVYSLFQKNMEQGEGTPDLALKRKLHKTIKKVTDDIPALKFNTSIASLMELINEWSTAVQEGNGFSPQEILIIIQLLAPFAPFMAEELWAEAGKSTSVHESSWPMFDPSLLVEDTIEYAVQVNGKVRGKFAVASDADRETIETSALSLPELQAYLEGKTPTKIIVVPKRLVNIVV